jgi:ribosomal protein S18 acetylase RimI-like enzyme
MAPSIPLIRAALLSDDATLQRIDATTYALDVSPAPPPSREASFFESVSPGDVLVADVNGVIAGYVELGRLCTLKSSAHAFEIKGLAVEPGHRRLGIGRVLVNAAIDLAKQRNARRVVLRVLGSNFGARALYEACGFRTEGILREQFFLDGRYVDDVLMAIAPNS